MRKEKNDRRNYYRTGIELVTPRYAVGLNEPHRMRSTKALAGSPISEFVLCSLEVIITKIASILATPDSCVGLPEPCPNGRKALNQVSETKEPLSVAGR